MRIQRLKFSGKDDVRYRNNVLELTNVKDLDKEPTSTNTFINFLNEELNRWKTFVELQTGKFKGLQATEWFEFILETHELYYDTVIFNNTTHYKLYTKDYNTGLYYQIDENVNELIKHVLKLQKYMIINTNNNFKTSLMDNFQAFEPEQHPHITKLKRAPSNLVLFDNGILNLHGNQFYFNDSLDLPEYHFFNRIPIDYEHDPNKINKKMLSIVKRIFDDWSGGDPEMLNLLLKMCYASIEGKGREKIFILKSNGGDGKSTFLRICDFLAGKGNTLELNLDQLNDDNSLYYLTNNIKLILGDDLESNTRIVGRALSRIKILTTGGSIQINVKFQPNKLINTTAVWIQNTNTDLKFYENNNALSDRLVIIEWPNLNKRSNREKTFDLDKLTGKNGSPDKTFYQTVFYYITSMIDYFEHFEIPEKIKNHTINSIKASNTVANFFEDVIQNNGIDQLEILPANVMYQIYSDWLKVNNPSAKLMSSRTFVTDFDQILRKQGYRLSNQTERRSLSYFKTPRFSLAYLNKTCNVTKEFNKHTKINYWMKTKNFITEDDLTSFKSTKDFSKVTSPDDLSLRELIMSYMLIENNDSSVVELIANDTFN